jgi:hypothetical protein
MFRSQFYDHHQGSIAVLVQLLLISVPASSYSGLWLYVVCASVRMVYHSVWCLAIPRHIPVCGCMLSVRLCVRSTIPCGVWLCTLRTFRVYVHINEKVIAIYVFCFQPDNGRMERWALVVEKSIN